eukprot:8740639-Pyramimonas_sp.AAC.1
MRIPIDPVDPRTAPRVVMSGLRLMKLVEAVLLTEPLLPEIFIDLIPDARVPDGVEKTVVLR